VVSASVAGDVRRAVEYIESNLMASVTLADIARAAGLSCRVLFRRFRNATGLSPMAYLRNARFARARDALRRAAVDDRIVDIAALWGFDHMGRFAIEYRHRFGERPSDTKAAARLALPGGRRSAGR
jgi:transcriptional regulator GlxA family with amidase domain